MHNQMRAGVRSHAALPARLGLRRCPFGNRKALGDVVGSGLSFRSDLTLLAVCGGDGAGGGAVRLYDCATWTTLGGARLGSAAVGVAFASAGSRGDPGRLIVGDLGGATATSDAELVASPALTAANARGVRSRRHTQRSEPGVWQRLAGSGFLELVCCKR